MIAAVWPSVACKLRRAIPQLLPAAARSMSGPAIVDQMLGYVWKDLQGQGQAAVDVLRSGLQMQPDPTRGFDSARLNLALAEVFAAEHNWAEAAVCSQAAAAAAAAGQGSAAASAVAGLARFQASRALLVTGRDAEAASSSSSSSDQGSAAQLAHQLMVQHASTAMEPAAASSALQQLQQALQQQQQQQPGSGSAAGILLALSHKVAGDTALALGELDAASSSFAAAKGALEAGSGSGKNSSNSNSSSAANFVSDSSSCLSSRFQQEMAADVALGAAQVLMAQKQWEASEESLSAALAAAEAAGGDNSPMLAPVLLLLGYGYARSARVMFAEGMLREAAKMMGGTEPDRLVARSSSSSQLVHPSLKAVLCWRYCQLLTALPNRTAEAKAWGEAAQALWEKAGAGFSSAGGLAVVLGDDVALTGKGQHGHGRGAVVSLFLRRLAPSLLRM